MRNLTVEPQVADEIQLSHTAGRDLETNATIGPFAARQARLFQGSGCRQSQCVQGRPVVATMGDGCSNGVEDVARGAT